jgi:hypothetical protein
MGVFSMNDRIRRYRRDWFEHAENCKNDECRNRLFSTCPEEGEILVNCTEGECKEVRTGP